MQLSDVILTRDEEKFARSSGGVLPVVHARLLMNALRAAACPLSDEEVKVLKELAGLIKEALSRKGPNVIISRRACALYSDRNKRKRRDAVLSNKVDKEVCKKPYTCIRSFHCPAISIEYGDRKAMISKELCDKCDVCAKLCPFGSIRPRGAE